MKIYNEVLKIYRIALLHFVLLFSASPALSGGQPTMTIYGELHVSTSCTEQRRILSKQAHLGKHYLFSENVYLKNSIYHTKYLEQVNRDFLGSQRGQEINIWGLEDYSVARAALLMAEYYQIIASFKRHKGSSNLDYLGAVQGHWQRSTRINLDFEYLNISHPPPNKSDYSYGPYDFWFTQDKVGYVEFAYLPPINSMLHILEPMTESISLEKGVPVPDDLNGAIWATDGDLIKAVNIKILWRNYLMLHELSVIFTKQKLSSTKDIAIVLGNYHVPHFRHLVTNVSPFLFSKYKVVINSTCLAK